MKPLTHIKNRTILIIEDDNEDQLLFHSAFKEAGVYNPLVFVSNGQDVLEYMQTQGGKKPGAISLIILDVELQDMSGLKLLETIKSDPETEMLPVVVMSGSQNPEYIKSTYELGGSGFIRKPSSTQEFKKTIQHLANYWLKVCELPII